MNTKILKTIIITSLTTISLNAMAMKSSEMTHHLHHKDMNHQKEMSHENHEMSHNDEENAIYVCPMHPEVISETPSSCSICGMHLEKTYFDEE